MEIFLTDISTPFTDSSRSGQSSPVGMISGSGRLPSASVEVSADADVELSGVSEVHSSSEDDETMIVSLSVGV